MSTAQGTLQPRIGMLATVRNRRGVVTAVAPNDGGPDGRLHLVSLDYLDPDGPPDNIVAWEREVDPNVVELTALPTPVRDPRMPPHPGDAAYPPIRTTALCAAEARAAFGDGQGSLFGERDE